MSQINIKDNVKVDLTRNIVNFFQPILYKMLKAIEDRVNQPYRTICLRSGRSCTKSSFDALIVIMWLCMFPNTSFLVNIHEFNSIKTKFIVNLKNTLRLYNIPKEWYELDIQTNKIVFYIKHAEGNSYIQFGITGKGDLSAQGSAPEHGKWCGILNYEVGQWSGWNLSKWINYNATFPRDFVLYKKGTLELAEKDDPEAWSPVIQLLEYNNVEKSQKTYSFYKEIDEMFAKDPKCYYLKTNYKWMTKEEQLRFIGPAGLENIKTTKKLFPLLYKQIYEGEEVNSSDSIYIFLDKERFLEDTYNDIDWTTATVNIGVDCGNYDATTMMCKVIWGPKDKRRSRTIAHWYHCNRDKVYEKWDFDHKTKDKATQKFEYYSPIQYCYMIDNFYNYIFAKIGDKMRNFDDRKIHLVMDMQGMGSTWYSLLFLGDSQGRSIIHPGTMLKIPNWLDPLPQWSKFGETVEDRIPFINHALIIPGCFTSCSEREFDAFNTACYKPDGTRDENPSNRNYDIDTLNTSEYCFRVEQYYDLAAYYDKWVANLHSETERKEW